MTKRSIARVVAMGMFALAMVAGPMAVRAQGKTTVLQPGALQELIPARVFYRGQTTTTQLRNSYGVKFSDGYYVLATLVDTSGYSNAVASKFEAYFITEVPIHVGGMRLGAGVYGIGFTAANKFVVTDVGGHTVLTVNAATDSAIKHPRPLEVLAQPGGRFRLYIGRRYVDLSR